MSFRRRIAEAPLVKTRLRVIQMSVGNLCNLACRHCFEEAGPAGDRRVSRAVLEDALAVIDRHPSITTADVTGGSPELIPEMGWFLEELGARGQRVLFRTNLLALRGAREEILPRLRELRAEVVASLPGLSRAAVDRQRGQGVFEQSLAALRQLNELGFGTGEAALSLAYNPAGDELPPPQAQLEETFRASLARLYGLRFDRLYAFVNVPLGRMRSGLRERGRLGTYLASLRDRFNVCTLERLMCRTTVTVGYDGRLYDCEFNRAAGLPLLGGAPRTARELAEMGWSARVVAVADHCYACTADAGFS